MSVHHGLDCHLGAPAWSGQRSAFADLGVAHGDWVASLLGGGGGLTAAATEPRALGAGLCPGAPHFPVLASRAGCTPPTSTVATWGWLAAAELWTPAGTGLLPGESASIAVSRVASLARTGTRCRPSGACSMPALCSKGASTRGAGPRLGGGQQFGITQEVCEVLGRAIVLSCRLIGHTIYCARKRIQGESLRLQVRHGAPIRLRAKVGGMPLALVFKVPVQDVLSIFPGGFKHPGSGQCGLGK